MSFDRAANRRDPARGSNHHLRAKGLILPQPIQTLIDNLHSALIVGLFPAALSTGIGSPVQKPLAVVVGGRMAIALIIILIALPC
jgi:hypothetical protein